MPVDYFLTDSLFMCTESDSVSPLPTSNPPCLLLLIFHIPKTGPVDFHAWALWPLCDSHKALLIAISPHPCFPSCARMIVCNQVMKFILDRIDKDERQAAKRRKKEEVVEAKRRLANASKLSSLLYRHKESLKMEILKKRALLDKELQLEAQVQTTARLPDMCPMCVCSS